MSTNQKSTPPNTSSPLEALIHQETQILRETNELLEKQVKSRTTALKRTNEQLKIEIDERKITEQQLHRRIKFDRILHTMATHFINLDVEKIDGCINDALKEVGKFYQSDRSYIYLLKENGRALHNTHVWQNPEDATNFDDFKNLPADLFQNWLPRLRQQETISVAIEATTCSESKLLALQGIRFALIIPLIYGQETIGFFGLDSHLATPPWQKESVDPLRIVATIIVSALMRKKTEDTLTEERNFAHQIMATMGQGLVTASVEGEFNFLNASFANMLGFAQEELKGKTWLTLASPADQAKLVQAQMENLDGIANAFEASLTKADGSLLYVLVNSVPNYDRQGRIIGSIATITDLTERRNAEAYMRANAEEVKIIYQAVIQLFKPSNLNDLALQIAEITINEFNFDSCGVLLLNKPIKLGTDRIHLHPIQEGNYLTWLARLGQCSQDTSGKIMLKEEGLISTAVRLGEIVYAPDVSQDSRYIPDNTFTQSELVIPLRAYDHIIGVIDLQSPHLHGFSQRDQRIITVFAEHAGLALETVHLYDQLREHAQELEVQIRERNKIEQALRTSEQLYKQLVENATDIIYRTDPNGHCTYVNPVTIYSLGYKNENELIGQHFTDFVHPDFVAKLLKAYKEQKQNKVTNTYYEFKALAKNGKSIWLGQNVQLIIEQGKVIGYQALARDITKRREAEEKLRNRSNELNATNAKLAKALRAKDEFLANMSHELRTPLNAILGKSEILLEGIQGNLSEKQAASVQVIEESGRHLLELINDILDIAKIEAGKIVLDFHPVSLSNVCESSMQFVRQMAFKKQIKLQANVDRSLTTCLADERRLKQILINLLSNAVKFTPAGGEVGLNVSLEPTRNAIQFQVWDTGIGISLSDMDRLFQPFAQLDSSLARAHEGTGLGLSLVYHLTAMHGGSISLESQPGVGSCFTVYLPQNPPGENKDWQDLAKADQNQHRPAFGQNGRFGMQERPLILVMEDDDVQITAMSEYLPVWGYRLSIARSGLEGLNRAQIEKPDLILMDLQLPAAKGLSLLEKLRQEKSLAQVPMVVLTTLALPGQRERCLKAGADEYLRKPIQLGQLALLIDELLEATREKC